MHIYDFLLEQSLEEKCEKVIINFKNIENYSCGTAYIHIILEQVSKDNFFKPMHVLQAVIVSKITIHSHGKVVSKSVENVITVESR